MTSSADALRAAAAALALLAGPATAAEIVGDAMPASLTGAAGDPDRGRALVADRQASLCILCHTAPLGDRRFQGDLAPDLAGVGARLSDGQIRLRVADARRLNGQTIMPPYLSVEARQRVGPAFRDKPILTPAQIEDIVAWLATLK
ncbi:MAG: sulfur oxidation c-type cytochrome SoxX [Methylobacteriaceae bacterium]|nr:sulfur oxidation c-type cytochrome SoxX [Methylobacteriaceae bacterium]